MQKKNKKTFYASTIFYVVIDGLLRMNEMLIIAYELTQIPHTGKRIEDCCFSLFFFLPYAYANRRSKLSQEMIIYVLEEKEKKKLYAYEKGYTFAHYEVALCFCFLFMCVLSHFIFFYMYACLFKKKCIGDFVLDIRLIVSFIIFLRFFFLNS